MYLELKLLMQALRGLDTLVTNKKFVNLRYKPVSFMCMRFLHCTYDSKACRVLARSCWFLS